MKASPMPTLREGTLRRVPSAGSLENPVIRPEDRKVAQDLARRASEEAEIAREQRQQNGGSPPSAGADQAPPAPRRIILSPSPRPDTLNEEKHEAFRKLAIPRVTAVLAAMEQCKYLSSKERYDYTRGEFRQMLDAMLGKLREIETAFSEEGRRRPREVFSFADE